VAVNASEDVTTGIRMNKTYTFSPNFNDANQKVFITSDLNR